MTKKQISLALEMAKSNTDFSGIDLKPFFGYALRDFKPLNCTIEAVASLMRYQCFQMNGEIDTEEFDDFCDYAKRLFNVYS
jgi:hypothetical protein